MTNDASARARLLVQEILHPDEMDRFVAACIAHRRRRTWPGSGCAPRPTSPGHAMRPCTRPTSTSTWPADIAATLLTLLDEPDQYPAEDRALLRGAVDYFLDAERRRPTT